MLIEICFDSFVTHVAYQRCLHEKLHVLNLFFLLIDICLYLLTIVDTSWQYDSHYDVKKHATDFALGCTFPLFHEMASDQSSRAAKSEILVHSFQRTHVSFQKSHKHNSDNS